MKKKVWELRIVDNPNQAIGGENDQFYTTDTEAFLIFNLADENFSPTEAMLTLVNSADRSVISETVPVVGGTIEWEMREEIIEHAGNWQAQLVYKQMKDGKEEKYTSQIVTFSVSGHLLDTREAGLVAIENWNNFANNAKDLFADWEDLEEIRQLNEEQRIINEEARQENYNELVDTGIMQENINQKLADAEQEYAPRLTELEQNDADLTAQLAQTDMQVINKMDKNTNDISVYQINKNKGLLDESYMSESFLQQIVGATPISAVVANGGIITKKLADRSVTNDKLETIYDDLLDISRNLYNPLEFTKGQTILADGREFPADDTYGTSGYIKVEPGDKLFFSQYVTKAPRNVARVTCFNCDMEGVSEFSLANISEFLVPPEICYVRITIRQITGEIPSDYYFMVEFGGRTSTYEPYRRKIKDYVLMSDVESLVDEKVNSLSWMPTPARLVPEFSGRGGEMVLDSNGDTFFLRNDLSNEIRISVDGWRTSTSWYDLSLQSGKVMSSNAIALTDKKLLIAFKHDSDPSLDGWYILEEVSTGNFRFERVLTPLVAFSNIGFGNTKYPEENPQIILVTEYDHDKNKEEYSRHVHLSEDGGESWRVIFDLPQEFENNTHAHSAYYDPYSDRMWVVTGDEGATNTWYSDDWRGVTPTWDRVYPKGQAPIQFTSIYASSDMVIFGSDGIGVNGVWGMERNPVKLKHDIKEIKPLFVLDEREATLYVARNFKRNKSGTAIYGLFTDNGNEGLKGTVLVGSVDGVRWYEIYRTPLSRDNNFNNFWVYNDEVIWWELRGKARANINWVRQ